MSGDNRVALPDLTYLGGTQAMTTTPVAGTPAQPYPPMFVPLREELRDGEMRVTVLGSGNPPPTRAQASGSVLSRSATPSVTCSSSTSAVARWRTSSA